MAKKIFVVEDDKDIRHNMKLLLESEGYAVEVAENGQVALDMLNAGSFTPSLIVLDLMMPVMDGFQFREVQEKLPHISQIPVVIMTADGHVEEKKMRVGAVAGLRKPANVDEILSMVKKHA
jgi:CheY-like chemotaxis protein